MYHRLDSYKLNTTLTFSAYGYETCGTPAELYGYETCSVHTELTKSTFTAVFCNAKNPSRQDFGLAYTTSLKYRVTAPPLEDNASHLHQQTQCFYSRVHVVPESCL